VFVSFFTLKAELQVFKFAINWQNFAQVGHQLNFPFRIRLKK